MTDPRFSNRRRILLALLVLLLLSACQPRLVPSPSPVPPPARDPISEILDHYEQPPGQPSEPLKRMGFSVQVGAFTQMDNAVQLEQNLKGRGVDAYHFLHESGFYKVRFGDHADYAQARAEAERLKAQGVLDSFFIVIPEDYSVAKEKGADHTYLRAQLVATARRFLGVPYRWGGEDRHNGFDCSGLTMVSYRLNGLKLPRNSRAQFKSGRVVKQENLRAGDLVFFATKGGTRVTHVGMYIGDDQFIHAPRPGKTVRIARLSSGYFRKTFVGAKTYL